jgi:hypothetical protein
LTAQITQGQSDKVVLKRMSRETQPYTIYAKEDIQAAGMTITTSNEEVLELDYPCWVYYISYTRETDENAGRYLIINENSGSLLEVNTKNDTGPSDLAAWRSVPGIAITPVLIGKSDSFGSEIKKQNLVIRNETEWENLKKEMNRYIKNETDNFTETEIDFNAYQVIAIFEGNQFCNSWTISIADITEYTDSIVVTTQNIEKEYEEIYQSYLIVKIPASDKKIVFQNDLIEIPFTEYSLAEISCKWKETHNYCKLIIINSNEELENYFACTDSDFAIDFSKYTLLAMNSSAPAFNTMNTAFFKNAANKYILNVIFHQNNIYNFFRWSLFILTPKIADDAIIALDLQFYFNF